MSKPFTCTIIQHHPPLAAGVVILCLFVAVLTIGLLGRRILISGAVSSICNFAVVTALGYGLWTAQLAVWLNCLPVAGSASETLPWVAAAVVWVGAVLAIVPFRLAMRGGGYSAGGMWRETARLRRFVDTASEGILFLRNGAVVDANPAFCRLLGGGREAVLDRPVESLLTLPREASGLAHGDRIEGHLVDVKGCFHPIEVFSRSADDTDCGETVLIVRDLTKRRETEERLRHLVNHDGLTGLPNRISFNDRLETALTTARRAGGAVALLCLDLDGFKAVNDLYGHPVGDEALAEVARRLADCCSESDVVARLGGDGFAIVQTFNEQPRAAAHLAERVLERLTDPCEVAGRRVCIGTSIGIALYPSDATTAEDLLRHADLALQRAKQEGRGRFRFFEPEMDRRLHQRRSLEHELRLALQQDKLQLHYQPLLGASSLQIEGFEALLRWDHPQRGRISPAEFVPVAEECGLIAQLGQWVLRTACLEAASWTQPWRIAVNLSPAQFRERNLAQTVHRMLCETGLDASRLELEITEGILIDDAERALTILRELKALGVRIALDDFGTGYSSLSYLRRFPFDSLKIDASFVRALGDGGEADAIVRLIVALGRSLSLHITAEGVETVAQLERLREHACDRVQGFLLGRPMPPEQLPVRPHYQVAAAAI